MAMSERRRQCAGPIFFGDQGVEFCEICGGCICCDFDDVDHDGSERRCFTNPTSGRCVLKAHAGRACQATPVGSGD